MTALHDISDCYLSLTCGEGWGMGAAEAASAGNPVFITGWSGHLDFLGDDYKGLVSYKLIPVIDKMGRSSHSPHQNWAKADIADAIDKLQSYTNDSQRWKDYAAQHQTKLKAFSLDSIAKTFQKILAKYDS